RRTCAQFGHTCQAGCQDTPTGFRCTCPRGYSLDEATGRRCQDVDECLATSRPPPCPAFEQCLNTIGSYHCRTIQCPAGYGVCLEPCRPEDRNCNSTNGNSLKFIVINVLPKHKQLHAKKSSTPGISQLTRHSTFAAARPRVTIIRTPDPDLAGKLGRMFQMKIKAECYPGGDKPIFRTTFNVYISIAAYNYGMPTLQFLFPSDCTGIEPGSLHTRAAALTLGYGPRAQNDGRNNTANLAAQFPVIIPSDSSTNEEFRFGPRIATGFMATKRGSKFVLGQAASR
uniref:EGF-like domain-containing protein n=1 Tax=Macrostomum lignano TaxID=282301 RepID=A0A1I8F7N9_9PLAT